MKDLKRNQFKIKLNKTLSLKTADVLENCKKRAPFINILMMEDLRCKFARHVSTKFTKMETKPVYKIPRYKIILKCKEILIK